MYFIYFCRLKKYSNMKRFILSLCVVVAAVLLACACENQHKCPAYGHYTDVPAQTDDNTLAER